MNTTPFGQQLRLWRTRAGISQLELASRAETTPRHVSFLETGRSRPGTEVVLRLAHALGCGLSEQNLLLRAAGLAPVYIEDDYGDDFMRPMRELIDRILTRHDPYPAWVIQGGLKFIQANEGGEKLLPGITAYSPEQIVDMWFGPGPFKEMVDNWEDVAFEMQRVLRDEAIRHPSELLDAAIARSHEYLAGVKRDVSKRAFPVVCPILRVDGQLIRTVSSVLRFETPASVTMESIRIELMFPVDEPGEAFFRGL